MSKSNILELARKLVAAIEKEDQKNKVMLKDIPVGGKADHKKKPIETEFIYIVRIIEGKQCVHEEEMVEESEDEAQERVLKKYCEDHEGKFYAVAERICRVKE